MKGKRFTFTTREGSLRLLVLFLALVAVFSIFAQLVITKGYKIEISDIIINVRGSDLHVEQYFPANADNNSSYPCILLTHGGSEPLAADSLMAWEFARRGFVVLNVSAYGAGMSDQANITEDGYTESNFWRGGAMGFGDVYEYALSLDIVDPTRICAWGHSTGMFLVGSAMKWSGQYLSLNDRLINVMHNELGVTFTQEEISQDADVLAKKKLSVQDYGYYLARRAEEEETVSHYFKAVRIIDLPFLYFNIAQSVGGFNVKRDPQCNLIIGLGTHELQGVSAETSPEGKNTGYVLNWFKLFKSSGFATKQTGAYYAGNTANYKTMFRTTSSVQRNSWYAIGDYAKNPSVESTLLGEAWAINTDNNKALQTAIDEGRARLFMNPVTMHNGNLWSRRAVSLNLEFFTQVCDYNNGELSDPNTKPIDTNSCFAGYIALVCSSLSFVAMMGAVCAMIALLMNSFAFKSAKRDLPVARMELKGKNFVMYAVATIAAGFIGAYGAQMSDESFTVGNALMNKWLPIEPGQARTYFMVYLTAIFGALFYFILGRVNKKKNGEQCLASMKEMNVAIKFSEIMKLLLVAIMMFAACYAAAGAINTFFEGRFMLIDGAFDLMKAFEFGRMMRYFIVLFPACIVISTLNNMVTFKGVSDSADTALNVLFTSLGMVLLMVLAFLITYSNVKNPDLLHIQCTLSIIPLVPITSYMYRKLYKLSGSPWLGAFFVCILLCWRCSGYVSHQFMWYGANELSAFWGIY